MLDSWSPPLLRGEAAVDAAIAAPLKPRDIVQGAKHHLVARNGVGLAVEDAPAEAGQSAGAILSLKV